MQDLFAQVKVNDILQFLPVCDFNYKIYIFYIYLIFYARRMGRKKVPRVKDNNLLGMQKMLSLDLDEKKAGGGRQGNLKISKLIIFNL